MAEAKNVPKNSKKGLLPETSPNESVVKYCYLGHRKAPGQKHCRVCKAEIARENYASDPDAANARRSELRRLARERDRATPNATKVTSSPSPRPSRRVAEDKPPTKVCANTHALPFKGKNKQMGCYMCGATWKA